MTARWAHVVLLSAIFALGACAPAASRPSTAQPAVSSPTARAVTPTPAADSNANESEESPPSSSPTATPRPLPTTTAGNLHVELIADGLVLPQSLTFAPDGRLFFVEVKKGQLRILNGRTLQPEPALTLDVARGAEHGLISLALDPNFQQNHFVYIYYTQPVKGNEAGRPRRHRLTRWTEKDGRLVDETPILDDLPVGKCCHTGGKMAFAADGQLFLALGDQGDADRRDAQNPRKLNGKILHFDPAQVLHDQPDPLTLIYASGLRNPYGLDIHPVTGAPILTDNGPDMCDELDLGREGANYGNPVVECTAHDPNYDDPIWDSGPDRLGVTGLRIYRGSMFPEFVNHPLFCSVNTGNLMHAVLEGPNYDHVARIEQVIGGQDGEGCRLDVAVAPDGSIYYSSLTRIYRLYR